MEHEMSLSQAIAWFTFTVIVFLCAAALCTIERMGY